MKCWHGIKDEKTSENPTALFSALWQPSKACEDYQDEDGRVLSLGLAENVVKRITDQPAEVTEYVDKREKETAPLPYSLSALQIDAAKRFGMSAQSVLDTCQRLYETHRLITYPRSDCRYLPEEHFAERHKVMNAISQHCQTYQTLPRWWIVSSVIVAGMIKRWKLTMPLFRRLTHAR